MRHRDRHLEQESQNATGQDVMQQKQIKTKKHALQFFFINTAHMHHICTAHITQDVVGQSL